MSIEFLEAKVREMLPGYEEMFSQRGGVTPVDPLEFHLYHLALYWSRLVGFCKQDTSKVAPFIESDLGACVQVGSQFANGLIGGGSPVYHLWQQYMEQMRAVLFQRPVTIENVESASRIFDDCLARLNYDPWLKIRG